MLAELVVNYRCKLAEGPLWHPTEVALYWTDIEDGLLYRFFPKTGNAELCYRGEMVGAMTLQYDGSLLLLMARGGVSIFRDGKLSSIHTHIPDEWDSRFNDAIADPQGRVLCGVMPVSGRLGRLYQLDPDGNLTVLLEEIGCTNGLGFTDNNTKIYYTDSARGAIYIFDYDHETGAISRQRVFWKSESPEIVPDGLTVDSEGYVWTAQWGGGCVIRLSPDGREDGRIIVPNAHCVSSITFGGHDLRDLYITTAARDDSTSENAGAIFRARPGVQGVAEYRSKIKDRADIHGL
jgi:sugar lactone lactonase YvrE